MDGGSTGDRLSELFNFQTDGSLVDGSRSSDYCARTIVSDVGTVAISLQTAGPSFATHRVCGLPETGRPMPSGPSLTR
jgi:hypothetical protein